MKRFRLSLPILLLPMILFAMLVQSPNVVAQDRVTIQTRRVVLTRSGTLARDFPERKKAIVRYPIVQGLPNATVLRRVRNTLAIKSAFGSTLAEYRQETWLEEFDYKVNYNKNYLLDITFNQSGVGAYPSTQSKHFLINLRDGKVIKAGDAFNPGSLAALTRLVDQKLKDEVKDIIREVESDKDSDAEQKRFLKEQLDQLTFTVQGLDEFSVSDKGVTFLYDAGFPHVIQALQPDGQYFFTFAELRPHLKGNGPLGTLK